MEEFKKTKQNKTKQQKNIHTNKKKHMCGGYSLEIY